MLHAIIIYGLWIVVSVAVIFLAKKPPFETLLRVLLGATGLLNTIAFLGHAFKANEIASYIGWPEGNPFQFEVGVANLALGVIGVMCLWIKDRFWLAMVVGSTVFGWGVAYGHIKLIVLYHNYDPGNAGLVLYLDIIVPLLMIILYFLYGYEKMKASAAKMR